MPSCCGNLARIWEDEFNEEGSDYEGSEDHDATEDVIVEDHTVKKDFWETNDHPNPAGSLS